MNRSFSESDIQARISMSNEEESTGSGMPEFSDIFPDTSVAFELAVLVIDGGATDRKALNFAVFTVVVILEIKEGVMPFATGFMFLHCCKR